MGYKVIVQGSVVVLIFAYIALGPYSSIYQQAISQIQGPVELAYRAVKSAISDIYLLATDPTSWYAKQQVINTKPETPISFPKSLEVTSLDSLPPSVPGGQPFIMNIVLQNQGDLPVKNVQITASCNQWCSTPLMNLSNLNDKNYYLCFDGSTKNQVWCARSCDTYMEGQGSAYTGSECVAACKNMATSVDGVCRTTDARQFSQNVYFSAASYAKGEGDVISISPFVAKSFTGREAETRIAKVYINVSFEHSTTSNLLVSVISNAEKDRLLRQNQLKFAPVVATAKVAPAKLSLNVGPQPLLSDKDATLLVSVSNDREDSRIVMPRGTVISITLPKEIGYGLNCAGSTMQNKIYVNENGTDKNADGSQVTQSSAVAEKLYYGIEPDPKKDRVEILPFEFNTVFVFICKFRTNTDSDVGTQKTGIVTANLTDYTFVHTLSKDVPVTTPVGILFDPYESWCNKCGSGFFSNCKPAECHTLSNTDPRNSGPYQIGACYFEYAGTGLTIGNMQIIATPQSLWGNACHSCGVTPSCDQFNSEQSCLVESKLCGMNTTCAWNNATTHPISGVTIKGACYNATVPGAAPPGGAPPTGPPAGVAAGACALNDTVSVPESVITNYIAANAPNNSILIGHGHDIYQGAVDAGVNPAFMLALAIHEAAWGTSRIAKDKNNLFGYGAYDSCPYDCAVTYSSIQDGINTVATNIFNGWLKPNPSKPPQRITLDMMSGQTPKNNGWLVYSPDVNWPNAMAGYMSKITGLTCSATEVPKPSSTVVLTSSGAATVKHDTFNSAALGETKGYNVILPPSYGKDPTRRYPVVYLLNGAWGDEYSWINKGDLLTTYGNLLSKGSIQEMIIAMPDGDNSGYENGCSGFIFPAVSCGNYEDYIINDFIPMIDSKYMTLADRDNRAIGGLSLGGRGAMYLAFEHPDMFSVVYGHSGLYYPILLSADINWDTLAANIKDVQQNEGFEIYFDVGTLTVDQLVGATGSADDLDKKLSQYGIEHTYSKITNTGLLETHDWPFWKKQIQVALVDDCQAICPATTANA